MSDDIKALAERLRPWRCDVTGNPVGTDTILIGQPPCDCQGCRAADALLSAQSALAASEARANAAQEEAAGLRDRLATAYSVKAEMNDMANEERHLRIRAESKLADAVGAINLALEYWAHRQQRYKNRHPAWVVAARAFLASIKEPGDAR